LTAIKTVRLFLFQEVDENAMGQQRYGRNAKPVSRVPFLEKWRQKGDKLAG
jgi:hypothetical protein